MRHLRILMGAAFALAVAVSAGPARAVVGVQVDDFEDGSVLNWQTGGIANPNPGTNISTGGPAGANDNFFRLTANGLGGAGGKLVTFNLDQWTGDYLDEAIQSIDMDVNCLSVTNPPGSLTLRLILLDGLSGQTLTTVAPVTVTPENGWTSVSFPLTAANLTGGDFNTVMGSVTELNLVYSPAVIAGRSSSPNVAAQLGVDNITAVAVPEPGAVALAALIGAGAAMRRRRRGRA